MASNQFKLRGSLIASLCLPFFCLASLAQNDLQTFSVSQAKNNATRLGSKEILVNGQFWWGKEGSMVFDSGYKAILIVKYSDEFLAEHPYNELFPYGKSRKSDIATIKGHLHMEADGKLELIADDIKFAEKPQ
jgi:hypothetical protein